jgi:hypothetical protein
MIFGFALLFIIGVLWILLVEGVLWKLILFFAGWEGLYLLLQTQPWAVATAVVIMGHPLSWAVVIPTAICFMALLTTEG